MPLGAQAGAQRERAITAEDHLKSECLEPRVGNPVLGSNPREEDSTWLAKIQWDWYGTVRYLYSSCEENTKVRLVKAMVYPVVMYGCESWTIKKAGEKNKKKKAERHRTDGFELWCWRRLLRVPWTARRSNQPILKEMSPEYSLEGLMLKLKLQYVGHLI